MRLLHGCTRRDVLRMAGLFGSSALFLSMASCLRKKDGVLVEVSEQLANAGVEVRDWRRNGANSISVQLFSVTAIPGNSWTLTIYDKDDRLLGTSHWLLLLGLALGIAAGFVNLFRSVSRADRELDDTK